MSGDTVIVGASFEASSATGVNGNQADNSAAGSGAAYVFVRSGGVWTQQAYLKASNTETVDRFGYSVAVSSNTVVVGAYHEDSNATGVNGANNNSALDSGAAYVFVRNETIWIQRAYLKASNTETNDSFGVSVAVSSDTAVVGANSEDSSATGINGSQANNTIANSGAAYVFVIPPGVPEIAVLGNNTLIPDGDLTPSTADHTDLGNQSVCSGTLVRTFTITNAGPDSLTVTAITFSGQHAVDFTFSGIGLPAAIPAGGGSTFNVRLNPSASGLRSTTLNLINDDADENPYNFAIQGTGVDPEVGVPGNGIPIAAGDLTPSATDATDFGVQSSGTATVRTFTVTNTGTAALNLTTLTVSGPQTSEFTLAGLPLPAAIAVNDATNFTVIFNPTAPGLRTATLTITNNDCDESRYTFALQGSGAALEFSSLKPTPAGVLLRLQGAPNEVLSLQWNSQPGPGGWQPLTNGTTDGTGNFEYTDPAAIGQPKRFYRATRP